MPRIDQDEGIGRIAEALAAEALRVAYFIRSPCQTILEIVDGPEQTRCPVWGLELTERSLRIIHYALLKALEALDEGMGDEATVGQ